MTLILLIPRLIYVNLDDIVRLLLRFERLNKSFGILKDYRKLNQLNGNN